jgi:hypothetical protein
MPMATRLLPGPFTIETYHRLAVAPEIPGLVFDPFRRTLRPMRTLLPPTISSPR